MPPPSLATLLARLPSMTAAQLRVEYARLYGEPTRSGNKPWLAKRVAWKAQCLAKGGLSEAALARADELARDADLRLNPPPGHEPAADPVPPPTITRDDGGPPRDPRLPAAGTVLTRTHKGRLVLVEVRRDGFLHDGVLHPSLSAAAKAATGCHLNGYRFFGLQGGGK
jgi:hypothetical protein